MPNMIIPKENKKTNDRYMNLSFPNLETQSHLTTQISVGVDIGKFKHHVSILEQKGKKQSHLVKKFFMKNSYEGFCKFLTVLGDFCQKLDLTKTKIALEATGHYYQVFTYWLKQQGFDPIIVNPA